MQETITKYLTGLPEDASKSERKLHKKYGEIASVRKKIYYDLKHGVTRKDFYAFLILIRKDPSYSKLQNSNGFHNRLNELETELD